MIFESASGLPSFKRTMVATTINGVVLDIIALGLVARKAHWNGRGPQFSQLHDLFGKLYDATNRHADSLAEYGAILGVQMTGDHHDIAKGSTVAMLPTPMTDVLALCAVLFISVKAVLARIDAACRSLATVDVNAQQLMIDASLALGKLSWMLAAHIPKVEGTPDA